ncbi:MAG: divalent metal cation transporter, partial [Acidobacteriaceae bacterium]
MPAAIHVRVYTSKQETARQLHELTHYAEDKGYTVVEVCTEVISGDTAGISGRAWRVEKLAVARKPVSADALMAPTGSGGRASRNDLVELAAQPCARKYSRSPVASPRSPHRPSPLGFAMTNSSGASKKSRNADPGAASKKRGWLRFLKILGPGLITGAADDDPSGIATYSQTGAQFGFGQLWTSLYQIPLLMAVQEACGRIGAVTGNGLTGVIKEHYSRKILFIVVLLVVVANTINIGADIGAVAEAGRLVVNVPFWILALATVVAILLLEVFVTYRVYSNFLKWLALALLSYPATALIVHQPWKQIFYATLVPHMEFTFAFLFIITGVFGTSISPYMFFWQTSQEVEEEFAENMPHKGDGRERRIPSFIRD